MRHVSTIPPAFGFASPWLLLGVGLAAVPVVIHLLYRRPHREIPWAATRFLLAATRKYARRLRLEQLVLLAVRATALAVAAAALARPYFVAAESDAGPSPPTHRVLVVDASYSMGQTAAGQTRLDRARAAAREIVDAARPGDSFRLVRMTGLGPRVVIGRPAYRPRQVSDALSDLTPTAGRAEPAAALRDVRELLKSVPKGSVPEVVLLSDFQKADWTGPKADDLRKALAAIGRAAAVRWVDAGQEPDANAAVADLSVEGEFVRTGRPTRLTATVRRYGEADRDSGRIDLYVDGRLAATEPVTLRPGADATVAFRHAFTEPGPHAVEVRLPVDALPIDDRRFLALVARDRLKVLLVDGTPRGRPEERATFYLRRALAPAGPEVSADPAAASDFEPTVIGDGELAEWDLAEFDAVVLANVGFVTDREAARLRAFAAAGGGVVLALGDDVRPEAYNRFLADAGPDALLPVRLGDRVGDPSRPERAFAFDAADPAHPIVRPFAGNPGAGLETDFVLAYAKTEIPPPRKDGPAAQVALRFDTGDPAIVAAPLGSGRVVLLTTSADTTWAGPWPQVGRSYLPLLHEAVRYAATGRPAGRAATVGEPIVWRATERIGGLTATVTTPSGSSDRIPAAVEPDGVAVMFDATADPGVYAVDLGPPVGEKALFARNVDPAEADLTPLTRAERESLAPTAEPPRPPGDASSPARASDWPASRWLLAAVAALLLAEPVLAARFAWGLFAAAALAGLFAVRAAWFLGPAAGIVATVTWLGVVGVTSRRFGRSGDRSGGPIR